MREVVNLSATHPPSARGGHWVQASALAPSKEVRVQQGVIASAPRLRSSPGGDPVFQLLRKPEPLLGTRFLRASMVDLDHTPIWGFFQPAAVGAQDGQAQVLLEDRRVDLVVFGRRVKSCAAVASPQWSLLLGADLGVGLLLGLCAVRYVRLPSRAGCGPRCGVHLGGSPELALSHGDLKSLSASRGRGDTFRLCGSPRPNKSCPNRSGGRSCSAAHVRGRVWPRAVPTSFRRDRREEQLRPLAPAPALSPRLPLEALFARGSRVRRCSWL